MAIKALLIRKKLDDAKKAREALTAKAEDLKTREAELAADIEAAAAEEEQQAVEAAVTAFEAEQAENEGAAVRLDEEIASLEKELAEAEAAEPAPGAKRTVEKENTNMSRAEEIMQIRSSKEYVEAFARYIKSGKPEEVRSLLTENASGDVAVPTLVYDIVKTAWDREGIMSRVKKAFIKGNLQVGFEISATGAATHTEGDTSGPAEETLVLGIVTLTPASIKKWITISDEAIDLAGEEFLRYIYNELSYQIAKKAADTLIAKIEACGTAATDTCVGVPVVEADSIALGTIAAALSELSDQATNPVIMMNKKTFAKFKAVQYGGNYAVDPFEGLDVVFNNSIASFDAATTGVTYAIVGDLGEGALANLPNGEEITVKYDDLSLAEHDLVKLVGREFVGIGVVADKAFVKVTKASS